MAFTRKFLTDHGVPEDQVDAIMAERNRTLADYVPKADVQSQIDEALKAAQPAEVDVTKSEEYLKLLAKTNKLEAFQTDAFSSVKAPYRDIVWDKLDHGEKHKDYAEQVSELAQAMPDLFMSAEPEAKPAFGGEPKGSAPTGKNGASFEDVWKFTKR